MDSQADSVAGDHRPPMGSEQPHDHVVHVYSNDAAITEEVARFISTGLTLGEGVVVVATNEHRAKIAELLDEARIDKKSVVMLCAAETLAKFMVAGAPDAKLFEATIGPILDLATDGGRPVRAFGEMVALLWAAGNVTGALALESLWNQMAQTRKFVLKCAYPATSLDTASFRAVNVMCQLHSQLSLLGRIPAYVDTDAAATVHMSRVQIPVPPAVSASREFTQRALIALQLPHLDARAAVVVSELAANAVRHAASVFRVTLSRDQTTLRIAVQDCGPGRPRRTGGSGLPRVKSVALRWGCDIEPDGKTVWADLKI